MINLLLDGEALLFVPFIGVALFFIVIVCIVVSAAKKADAKRREQQASAVRREATDGNGRTQHQRDYINGLRNKASQKKTASQESTHTHVGNSIVSNSDGHVHRGDEEEHYDEIVGSLGEVDDEGCADLDGVRLIAHDLAYEDGETNSDYSEVAKAVVLGDIINNPRFKGHKH